MSERQFDRMRGIYRSLKEVPCFDCGQEFAWYVMEFDHVEDGWTIGKSIAGHGLDKFLAEAMKCDVVCANCHKTRTYMREH